MHNARTAILQTLCYADIFDFALTKEELWWYLITSKPLDQKAFEKALATFPSHNGFYFLPKREKLCALRQERKEYSKQKVHKAKQIARIVDVFPTVLFIGLSGAVAADNATASDDIDFFVIAKAGTVWSTRLLLLIVFQLLGVRRKRSESHNVSGKVCLNMLLDETELAFSKEAQDLYTAHEILQVKPLVNKKHIYERFLAENNWIKSFLPNMVVQELKIKNQEVGKRSLVTLFEPIARYVQRKHMKKKVTNETISDTILAFHPFDYRLFVLQEFEKRVQKYSSYRD